MARGGHSRGRRRGARSDAGPAAAGTLALRVTGCCEVSTTVESEPAAAALAAALVERRLAACVQVEGPVRSTYRWKGSVETATEWTCRAKTADARVAELIATIRNLHTYEQPEIVVIAFTDGSPEYLEWIRSQTMP